MNKYRIRESNSRRAFLAANYIFLTACAITCLLPLLNMLAISFSSGNAAAAGYVRFWPVEPTLDAYRYVASKAEFWNSFLISVERIALGLPLALFITVITAYPMSKDSKVMPGRGFYTYFILIPMLFGGGLIPWFLTVRALGLTNNLLGLVIPGLVQTFNVILIMNFMRNLPKEIEESAFIDGAGPLTTLFKITLPLCLPSLATVALFIMVGHWNAWFDGIILMDSKKLYPLQSYLQSLIVQNDPSKMMNGNQQKAYAAMNMKTFKAAQIFIATVPVLIAYPFLQKYFTKGIVLGSVKG